MLTADAGGNKLKTVVGPLATVGAGDCLLIIMRVMGANLSHCSADTWPTLDMFVTQLI